MHSTSRVLTGLEGETLNVFLLHADQLLRTYYVALLLITTLRIGGCLEKAS